MGGGRFMEMGSGVAVGGCLRTIDFAARFFLALTLRFLSLDSFARSFRSFLFLFRLMRI
jgi:hypothetical protein